MNSIHFDNLNSIFNSKCSVNTEEATQISDFVCVQNYYTKKISQAHEQAEFDLHDLLTFVAPSEDERIMKKIAFNSLVAFMKKNFPNAELFITGSTGYDVDNRASDLDIVVSNSDTSHSYNLLQLSKITLEIDSMKKQDRSKIPSEFQFLVDCDFQLVHSARVPILMLRTPSGLLCDISCNMSNSLKHSQIFKSFLGLPHDSPFPETSQIPFQSSFSLFNKKSKHDENNKNDLNNDIKTIFSQSTVESPSVTTTPNPLATSDKMTTISSATTSIIQTPMAYYQQWQSNELGTLLVTQKNIHQISAVSDDINLRKKDKSNSCFAESDGEFCLPVSTNENHKFSQQKPVLNITSWPVEVGEDADDEKIPCAPKDIGKFLNVLDENSDNQKENKIIEGSVTCTLDTDIHIEVSENQHDNSSLRLTNPQQFSSDSDSMLLKSNIYVVNDVSVSSNNERRKRRKKVNNNVDKIDECVTSIIPIDSRNKLISNNIDINNDNFNLSSSTDTIVTNYVSPINKDGITVSSCVKQSLVSDSTLILEGNNKQNKVTDKYEHLHDKICNVSPSSSFSSCITSFNHRNNKKNSNNNLNATPLVHSQKAPEFIKVDSESRQLSFHENTNDHNINNNSNNSGDMQSTHELNSFYLRAAIRLIKFWVRSRRLPTMKDGGLPSVAWTILALFFCFPANSSILTCCSATDLLEELSKKDPFILKKENTIETGKDKDNIDDDDKTNAEKVKRPVDDNACSEMCSNDHLFKKSFLLSRSLFLFFHSLATRHDLLRRLSILPGTSENAPPIMTCTQKLEHGASNRIFSFTTMRGGHWDELLTIDDPSETLPSLSRTNFFSPQIHQDLGRERVVDSSTIKTSSTTTSNRTSSWNVPFKIATAAARSSLSPKNQNKLCNKNEKLVDSNFLSKTSSTITSTTANSIPNNNSNNHATVNPSLLSHNQSTHDNTAINNNNNNAVLSKSVSPNLRSASDLCGRISAATWLVYIWEFQRASNALTTLISPSHSSTQTTIGNNNNNNKNNNNQLIRNTKDNSSHSFFSYPAALSALELDFGSFKATPLANDMIRRGGLCAAPPRSSTPLVSPVTDGRVVAGGFRACQTSRELLQSLMLGGEESLPHASSTTATIQNGFIDAYLPLHNKYLTTTCNQQTFIKNSSKRPSIDGETHVDEHEHLNCCLISNGMKETSHSSTSKDNTAGEEFKHSDADTLTDDDHDRSARILLANAGGGLFSELHTDVYKLPARFHDYFDDDSQLIREGTQQFFSNCSQQTKNDVTQNSSNSFSIDDALGDKEKRERKGKEEDNLLSVHSVPSQAFFALILASGVLSVVIVRSSCIDSGWWSTDFLTRRDVRSTIHATKVNVLNLQDAVEDCDVSLLLSSSLDSSRAKKLDILRLTTEEVQFSPANFVCRLLVSRLLLHLGETPIDEVLYALPPSESIRLGQLRKILRLAPFSAVPQTPLPIVLYSPRGPGVCRSCSSSSLLLQPDSQHNHHHHNHNHLNDNDNDDNININSVNNLIDDLFLVESEEDPDALLFDLHYDEDEEDLNLPKQVEVCGESLIAMMHRVLFLDNHNKNSMNRDIEILNQNENENEITSSQQVTASLSSDIMFVNTSPSPGRPRATRVPSLLSAVSGGTDEIRNSTNLRSIQKENPLAVVSLLETLAASSGTVMPPLSSSSSSSSNSSSSFVVPPFIDHATDRENDVSASANEDDDQIRYCMDMPNSVIHVGESVKSDQRTILSSLYQMSGGKDINSVVKKVDSKEMYCNVPLSLSRAESNLTFKQNTTQKSELDTDFITEHSIHNNKMNIDVISDQNVNPISEGPEPTSHVFQPLLSIEYTSAFSPLPSPPIEPVETLNPPLLNSCSSDSEQRQEYTKKSKFSSVVRSSSCHSSSDNNYSSKSSTILLSSTFILKNKTKLASSTASLQNHFSSNNINQGINTTTNSQSISSLPSLTTNNNNNPPQLSNFRQPPSLPVEAPSVIDCSRSPPCLPYVDSDAVDSGDSWGDFEDIPALTITSSLPSLNQNDNGLTPTLSNTVKMSMNEKKKKSVQNGRENTQFKSNIVEFRAFSSEKKHSASVTCLEKTQHKEKKDQENIFKNNNKIKNLESKKSSINKVSSEFLLCEEGFIQNYSDDGSAVRKSRLTQSNLFSAAIKGLKQNSITKNLALDNNNNHRNYNSRNINSTKNR